MYLPDCIDYNYIYIVRDNFSKQPEAKQIKNPTVAKVAKFIQEDIIYRYRVFEKIKINRRTKFKGAVIYYLKKYSITQVQISTYNSKANGMVERRYQLIIATLIGLTNEGKKQ